MNYINVIAVLAVFQLVFFSILVGRARVAHGIEAPAVSGHEMFERAYRVQMNTLEQIVAFLPALFIAARYWPAAYVARSVQFTCWAALSTGVVICPPRPVVA